MEEIKKTESTDDIQVNMGAYKRSKQKVWTTIGIASIILTAIFALGSLLLLGNPLFGICIAVLSIGLCLVVWIPKELKRIKRNYCQECGAKYNYQTCVDWEVSEVEIKEKSTNPNSDRKQIVGVRVEYIDFTCTCEKCGKKTSFTEKYQTGEVYDDGSVKKRNIENVISKYFKV